MQQLLAYFRTRGGLRLISVGLLVASPILVVVNVLHIRSTELGDPYGVRVDLALVIVGLLLKWLVLFGCLMLLRRWFGIVCERPRQAALGMLAVGIPMLLLTIFLAVDRADWATRLSNSTEKYHSFESDNDEFATQDANYSRVSWLWKNGITQFLECAALIAILSMFAMLGVFGGRGSWGFAVFVVIGTLFLYSILFRLFVIDFDLFHGDIWSGAVLIDLLWPFPSDPYPMIASLYYATFAIGLTIVTWRQEVSQ